MTKLALFLLLVPHLAFAEFPVWEKMPPPHKWKILSDLSQTRPMNWGAGGNGINYGGEIPCLEGENPNGETRKPAIHDAASPSSGYCLGVSVHRKFSFLDLVQGKPVPPSTRAHIARVHENAGSYEYGLVQAWMKKFGETDYDRALARNSVGMKGLLDYAIRNPGGWIGLKSRAYHHAVQAFEVGGALIIVDPNIPEPMVGRFEKGVFVWATTNGKLVAEVDFVYLPALTWK